MPRKIDDPSLVAAATFNMTPMIDVTFQLIIVFLCSMKFRTLDQKLEAHLPKDRGVQDRYEVPEFHPVLQVRLQRRLPGDATRLVLQGAGLGTVAEGEPLWARLRTTAKGFLAWSPDLEAEIDAEPAVDHGDVMRTLDGLVAAGLVKVRFKGAARPPTRR